MSTASSRILISLASATVMLAGASKQPLQAGTGAPEMMSMPLVAPFFVESGDYQSSMTMINELTKQVHGTVIARGADGSELGRKVMTFPAHSRTVLTGSELLGKASEKEITGSIELIPNPMEVTSMAIAAQLSIVGTRAIPPTYLEEEFISVDPHLPSQYRAVVPSAVTSPTIALFSTSTSQQRVEVTCLMENGSAMHRSVDLEAGHMLALPACNGRENFDSARDGFESVFEGNEGRPRAVALDVSTNAAPGSLAAWGISAIGPEHRAKIALNFTNVASLRSKETIFAGVPIGSADLLPGSTFEPDLAVANYGRKPTAVSVSYTSMIGDSPQVRTVATMSLSAGTVQHVSLPSLSGDPLFRNSFIISSDAEPGAVISNLVLRGQKQYPAVQLMGKDTEVNNGGGHPWSIEGANQSTALLFNRSEKAELFNVNIVAEGKKWHQEYQLQPNETKAIDIGDLIRNQTKDTSNATLPASAQTGEISWFTVDPGKGAGRVLVSSAETGLARNFSCGYNIVLCGAGIYTSAINLLVLDDSAPYSLGQIFGLTCTAYDPNACSGQSYGSGGGGYSYSWQATSPSIATISGSTTSQSATFHGNSVGTGGGNGFVSNGHCSPGRGGSATVQSINTVIQNNGLSGIITSAVYNGNGSYTLGMSLDDYNDFYAGYQSDGSCGCPNLGQVLSNANKQANVTIQVIDYILIQWLKTVFRNPLPSKAAPNSNQTHNTPNGKVVRVYGSDGKMTHDIDYGDQSHSQWDPEVHDWNWSSGSPVRQAPRQPQPADFPPGISKTWP